MQRLYAFLPRNLFLFSIQVLLIVPIWIVTSSTILVAQSASTLKPLAPLSQMMVPDTTAETELYVDYEKTPDTPLEVESKSYLANRNSSNEIIEDNKRVNLPLEKLKFTTELAETALEVRKIVGFEDF